MHRRRRSPPPPLKEDFGSARPSLTSVSLSAFLSPSRLLSSLYLSVFLSRHPWLPSLSQTHGSLSL
uniref:Uncharacterized protein n=1 Tax=Fagus sylvatica TaxID=28930 RepID=A0A2N9G664_FAGSY